MTKDRIDQLRASSSKSNKKRKPSQQTEESEEVEENETTALTIQPNESVIVKIKTKDKSELNNVYNHVNIINEDIGKIQEDIVQLKRYHVRLQQSTRTDPSLRKQIDSVNENIKTTAFKIKNGLQELEKEKKGDEEKVIDRVVKTQHSLLTKRFKDTMEDYESSLSTHLAICTSIIQRQLQIVIQWLQIRKMPSVPADRVVTEEELCSILDSEDTQIFVDNVSNY